MVSFKKKLEQANTSGSNQCEPGPNKVSFKEKIPPEEVPTPPTPPTPTPPTPPTPTPGEGGPVADQICSCIGDKLDQIDSDIQATYDTGPSFNTGKLFSSVATPIAVDEGLTSPSPDPNIIGFYDEILVAPKRGGINATRIWVIADPDKPFDPNDPFIYVRFSNGGSSTFSPEIPVRVAEDWGFRDVYSFRIRTPFKNQQYRITTDPHRTSYVSTVVNIPPGSPGATSAPVANRPNFIARKIFPLAMIDKTISQLLGFTISIPNGFAIFLVATETNNGTIFISRDDATNSIRSTALLAGSNRGLFITSTDLIHVTSSDGVSTLELVVEQ